MAKNPIFMQKEIDTWNTNNATVALITKEELNIKSLPSANSVNDEGYHRADHRRFTRKHSRLRSDRTFSLKLGTLTTIENAHNTAGMKCSVCPVVNIAARPKDGKDSPK